MNDISSDHLIEVVTESTPIFQGNFIRVMRDVVCLPDGKQGAREYVRHPGAVMVIAVTDDGLLVMERQFRCALRQVFWELPAGKLDPSEEPLACAQRELLEETGYSATTWQYLGSLHPCIGYSTEVIHAFFATGLVLGNRVLDEGEFLDVELVPWQKIWGMATSAELTDGKTIVGLLWAKPYLDGVSI